MIVCRECHKEFPKPATRGRPPVKCPDCRNGVSVPASMPAKKAEHNAEPQTAVTEPSVTAKKAKPYRSGFCNRRHGPEIHRLCSGQNYLCVCDCHA